MGKLLRSICYTPLKLLYGFFPTHKFTLRKPGLIKSALASVALKLVKMSMVVLQSWVRRSWETESLLSLISL